MKNLKTASALLTLSLLMVGCNSGSEKYTGIAAIGSIESGMIDPIPYRDVVCGEAKELDVCLDNKDICQPLYKDNVDPLAEKIFVSCIANLEDPSNLGPQDPVKDIAKEPAKEPVKEPASEDAPDLADIKDCSKLDAKYLSQKSNGQPKVIICHHDCHGESHAIEVACPALKAHLKHQEGKDYVGACKE